MNGSKVQLGHLVEAGVPKKLVARMQVLEYLRTFLASRPAWSQMGALPLVSGAFGVWKRSAVIAVGGFTTGHMGEDMDLTMRLHRHHIDNEIPYRIVYEPSAVIWTEVPDTLRVLRRQRIRWHRGLMTAVKDFMPMTFNPKYGKLGMITWAAMFLFEYLAPVIEFLGWITILVALLLGALNTTSLVILLAVAFGVGLINSLIALLLDESYGYFNSLKDTLRLIVMALIENFGMRQITVVWRIRAIIGGKGTRSGATWNARASPTSTGRCSKPEVACSSDPFGEAGGLLVGAEGGDEFVEVALEDLIETLQGEADPVVGDPVLLEVIGADLLGTPTRAHL